MPHSHTLRIAFYIARYPGQTVQTPPSVEYLAGYLVGQGLVEPANIRYVESTSEAVRFAPDILGVSSVSQCMADARRCAAAVRNAVQGVWTVLGGYHITGLPTSLPEEFDIGVIGEGEQTFADVVGLRLELPELSANRLGGIDGIGFHAPSGEVVTTAPRSLIKDIDALPKPLRRFPYGKDWPYVFTARGCPYKCRYCASHRLWSAYRPHSADYVVEEIHRLVEEFGVSTVYMVDDLFIAPKSRLRKIRDLLRARGLIGRLTFRGFVRINLVDEETIQILKELNFVRIRFGLETASESLLAQWKDRPFTLEQVENVLALTAKYNMSAGAAFMFGFPGEQEDDIRKTLDFIKSHRHNLVPEGIYLCQPVPGSALWDECARKGLVSPDMDFSRMELDLTRPEFDWDHVLYTNEENIPKQRFRKLVSQVLDEVGSPGRSRGKPTGGPAGAPADGGAAVSRIDRAKVRLKDTIKGLFRLVGLDVQYRRSADQPQAGRSGVARRKVSNAKLYAGSGDDTKYGYLRSDVRSLPGVDVVCPAWRVSDHCEDLEEIYSRHMLEHLTLDEAMATLKDWRRALKPGGRVRIVVPNIEAHLDQYRRAEWSEETLRDPTSDARWGFAGLYGWQARCDPSVPDYAPDYTDVHKSGYNQPLLKCLLELAGFSNVETWIHDRLHLVARAEKVESTGERQVAPRLGGIRSDHLQRYRFAATLASPGAAVLDVACGVGYGSWVLATEAASRRVVGIDISEQAVQYAQRHYADPRIEYRCGDALGVPIEEAAYDLAVSFETIEHLDEPLRLLERIRAALRPDGIFLCSTPNETTMPFDRERFPFHIRHYRPEEFRELLERGGFRVSAMKSQRSAETPEIVDRADGAYIIALCRRREQSEG